MICPLQKEEGADLVLDYCSNRLEPEQAVAVRLSRSEYIYRARLDCRRSGGR